MKITIKHANTVATINLMGAYLEELEEAATPILFPYTLLKDAFGAIKTRGGSHLCLPNFGAPGQFEGLVQHGYARLRQWLVLEQGEDFLRLQLKGEGAYEGLIANLSYEVGLKSLKTSLELLNIGREPLTVAPGFHPYFPTQSHDSSLKVNGEELRLDELEGTLFRNEVKIAEVGGVQIRFETDNLNRFAIWTDLLANYVCVEPTYAANSFDKNPSENLILGSEQTANFAFTISW